MTHSQARELDRFTDKVNATERTLRALGNVGFEVSLNTDTIAGTKVETYSQSTSSYSDRAPDIAAAYTDPNTGNTVTLGMNLNGHDIQCGPYDWTGKTSQQADGNELAGGGNHDNNQPELVGQLTYLLAAAHFDKPVGTFQTWTPEYREWEAGIKAQLNPIYYDAP